MKVFVDTHVLIDYLVNADVTAARTINNIFQNHQRPVISTLSLAIINYFADKKFKSATRKRKIAQRILEIFEIATPAVADTKLMLDHPDWEDGFQYYSAVQAKCRLIITDNVQDYFFSKIELMNVNTFNAMYL